MSTSIPHASSPHRLTHTCNLPCMKTISKTKYFCFSSHESFIGHTSIIMLDHPLIFFIGHTPKILQTTLRYFHWTYSENNVDYPPIFSMDTVRKYYGKHSENTVDNAHKILGTTLRYFLLKIKPTSPHACACFSPYLAFLFSFFDFPELV